MDLNLIFSFDEEVEPDEEVKVQIRSLVEQKLAAVQKGQEEIFATVRNAESGHYYVEISLEELHIRS